MHPSHAETIASHDYEDTPTRVGTALQNIDKDGHYQIKQDWASEEMYHETLMCVMGGRYEIM